jgi:hypothetical protein
MQQLAQHAPLSTEETANAIVVDMSAGIDAERIRKICGPVLALLQDPRRQDA